MTRRRASPAAALATAAAVGAGLALLAPAGLALLVPAGAPLSAPDRQEVFPHEEHAGLFPTCLGCHAGVPTGDAARAYSATEADCAACHDGRREEAVEWREPTPPATNLRFSHLEHAGWVDEAGEGVLDCQACHAAAGAESRMELVLARSEACLGCHAELEGDPVPDHLARESECEACHRPLAEAGGLAPARIAAFPEPPDHRASGFLLEHGEPSRRATVQCAVCHARESCARCHLNADRLDPVRELAPDPRVAGLVAHRPGEWPEPASHGRPDFALAHGELARGAVESCASCHARPSCTGCHGVPGPAWAVALPFAPPGGPQGVVVAARRPPGHEPAFTTAHGPAAATDVPQCSSCHRETQCADCHDAAAAGMLPHALPWAPRPSIAPAGWGEQPARVPADTVEQEATERDTTEREATGRRANASRSGPASGRSRPGPLADLPDPGAGFHPANFVLRHGAEAFAAPSECAECHSREVFCRSCHERSGFAATRQATSLAFHDAQPDWLLAHGQAARQNLEACASCHRQSSCLRCHSARDGLRVSPHGPGFDPQRVADRSTISCGVCHFADQVLAPP